MEFSSTRSSKILRFVLLLLVITQCSSASLLDLFKPVDYSSSTKWVLTRENVVGYGWESEGHSGHISSISVNDNKEYIVSCSARDGHAKFHRVLMYPNLYPDWTHLYYGDLRLTLANDHSEVANCIFHPRTNDLLVTSLDKKSSRLDLTFYSQHEPDNIENRLPVYKPSSMNKHHINTVSNFTIVFPLDNYNEIWRFNKTYSFDYSDQESSKKIQLSENSKYLFLKSSETEIVVFNLDSHEADLSKRIKKIRIANEEIQDWASFNQEGNFLIILTKSSKYITYYEDNDEWLTKEKPLPTPIPNIVQIESNLHSFQRNDKESCKIQPVTFVAMVDLSSNIHLFGVGRGSIGKIGLKLVKSFPFIDDLKPKKGIKKAIIQFSPFDASMISFQFPETHTIYVYQRDDHRLDYLVHSAIELPENRSTSAIQMFNLKYNYLLVDNNGHLNYYRESKPTVKPCDSSSRTKSFYLPPPPLYQTTGHHDIIDLERDGIFGYSQTYIIILLGFIIFALMKPLTRLETKVINVVQSKFTFINETLMTVVFYIASLVIFGLSIFEIINQSAFTNDWPAHIRHIQQWKNPPQSNSTFDTDFSHFMHYHGPCTYPAGFLILYGGLSLITKEYSLQLYQLIWAILELVNYHLIHRLCKKLNVPVLLATLPVVSNRLHLYNVRVVVNDFPNILLIHVCLLLLLNRRFNLFSVVYSFVVTLKLNNIFYSPAILFVLLNQLSLKDTIVNIVIMGLVQLIIGAPYLIGNYRAYIGIAYDFSRTLLWEKTRNFKFVGRVLYDEPLFNLTLLVLLVTSIIFFVSLFQRLLFMLGKRQQYNSELNRNRIFILAIVFVNFLAITFARGLYTPFLCWYFYTFPLVMYLANYPYTLIIASWLSHEILFRFFPSLTTEMFGTYIYFIVNCLVLLKLSMSLNISNSNLIQLSKLNKKSQ